MSSNNTYTHLHHIVPKHMGGTDDPSNLIELTVEDHAIAHRVLYKLYGHWQDYCAWQGLSGQLPKIEFQQMCSRRAQPKATEAARQPQAIENKKRTFARIKHQQGKTNSQYGTKWITDGVSNSKLKADAPMPEGWRYGRVTS